MNKCETVQGEKTMSVSRLERDISEFQVTFVSLETEMKKLTQDVQQLLDHTEQLEKRVESLDRATAQHTSEIEALFNETNILETNFPFLP